MTISKKSMKWIPWILILPVVIIRGFTTLYPIIVTLKNSLFDVKVLSGVNKFVGLANYVNVFKDPKVQTSISFTVEFVVVSMVFHVVLGVILALILNMKFKGRRFLRTTPVPPEQRLSPWTCGKTFRSLQSWYCQDFSLFPVISTKLQRWMGQTEYRSFSVSHYR